MSCRVNTIGFGPDPTFLGGTLPAGAAVGLRRRKPAVTSSAQTGKQGIAFATNPADLLADLTHQAVDATNGHAQASTPLTPLQQQAIVSFEMALVTAQAVDYRAGALNSHRGHGRPVGPRDADSAGILQRDKSFGVEEQLMGIQRYAYALTLEDYTVIRAKIGPGFRCLGGLTVGLALALLTQTHATAQSPDRTKLLVRPPGTTKITRGVPLTQGVGPQTVVLKMAGDPVAVVRSQAPGKQITDADQQSIESNLRVQQDVIAPTIEAMGGKVLAKFQNAINGIKVQATPAQIASLATLPGVVAVKGVRTYRLNNAVSVPFIGAPQAWQGPPGLHGEHVRVAVLDTGIDYTHANFGGPGTVSAFNAAFAKSTQPADPKLFGPNAPKVKGGIDLVGDAYDANDPTSVPVPDPNPLDCDGHGSHTSGTAAGFGVTAAGATYHGPYGAATPSVPFMIGPGVAPLADLYAVRVFSCYGATNVVVDAIDWAVQHNMQVISMSLGVEFGTEDDADAEASENAVDAGIVVVASAGNSGPIPYIAGAPASGDKVISVAAMDSHATFPAEALALSPTGSIVAQDSDGISLANGTSLGVVVLPDTQGTGSGGVSLGCDPAEYTAAVKGKLVVTVRGTCARAYRAFYAQQAGALAVAMINNAAGYPPFEGTINPNTFTGAPFTVTIPFLGIQGPSPASGDGAALKAASSVSPTRSTTVANSTFREFAYFSSAGPRMGDGHLKPNITAPGMSVFSTAMGTGNQGVYESGTSMAAPHVAGSAALAIQAHPTWDAGQVAAAVVNTADAAQLAGYSLRLGGNGLVQPFPATRTSVIARAADGTPALSFGVAEFTSDYSGAADITVENHAESVASFSVSIAQAPGSAHTATVDQNFITLPGHQNRNLHVKLAVPAATSGDSSEFREVQGRIVLTPTGQNNGTTLSVPYYLVPRARSNVQAQFSADLSQHASAAVQLNNKSNSVAGTADFYAWGYRGNQANLGSIGMRAVGVQSFSDPTYGQILVFAVNTFARTPNPVTTIYDIALDVNGDGIFDYLVEAADLGLITTGAFNGQSVVAVYNFSTGSQVLEFLTTAPTDGATVLLPLVAADVGVTSSNPRFSYIAQTLDFLTFNTDYTFATPVGFNAFNSSISTGAFAVLAPGAKTSVPISINQSEFSQTPALGAMVVALENSTTGGSQALLLPVSMK